MNNQLTDHQAPVTDEELDQMIWKLERDGMTPKLLSLMRELREVRRARSVVPNAVDENIDADDHPLLWGHNKGWNACRAAMRQTGNSPVTPDGWIPVSERMPEVGDIVLTAIDGCVNVGEAERSGANYRYFTSVISGRELPATHWQPLPAAPKEVG